MTAEAGLTDAKTPKDEKFRVYGENGATFVIFQSLAGDPSAVNLFLSRLKPFGTRRRPRNWGGFESVAVWLFPNFGKSGGFGEPDVVVLADDHVFWIEVETTIRVRTALTALHSSLVQLWRFFLFQQALARGQQSLRGKYRYVGSTIGRNGVVRDASLLIAGHGVLKDIRKELEEAGRAKKDHYVLFTIDEPSGEGLGYRKVLESEAKKVCSQAGVDDLPVARCWYEYWKGDLEAEYNKNRDVPLDIDEIYVRIKR